MRLKLEELRRVAKKTIKEEKNNALLREELFRLLGPAVMVSNNCDKVAEASNERLDLLESTGRRVDPSNVKLTVLLEASVNPSPEVRKLAARLLPVNMVSRLALDRNSTVRCAAARRLTSSQVQEVVRRHPGDDQLRDVLRHKKIIEAGLPPPEVDDEPFDMYGDRPLGAVAKSRGEEVTDGWYKRLAAKLFKEYGTNLEGQWEEILANRVAASYQNEKVDRERLLKAIYDCIEEREASVLDEGSLRSLAGRLRAAALLEEQVVMPVIEFPEDPLGALSEGSMSSADFVANAETVLRVRKSAVPAGIKKYRLGEGSRGETQVPVNATVPGGLNTRSEKVLDTYVKAWNDQQALRGEPYRISWGPHPSSVDMVGFALELK